MAWVAPLTLRVSPLKQGKSDRFMPQKVEERQMITRGVRRCVCRSAAALMSMEDRSGWVRLATPFGVVKRDPYTLPPMVSKAAEMKPSDFEDETRLAELREKVVVNEKAAGQLQALQELCFFPPAQSAPLFIEFLQVSKDELARSQAVFGLALLFETDTPQSMQAFDAVKRALLEDESPTVRSAAAGALSYATAPQFECSKFLLRQLFEDHDWLVKMSLAVALGAVGNDESAAQMIPWLRKADPQDCAHESLLIQAVIGALGQLKYEPAVEELERWAGSSDRMIRMQTAEALHVFFKSEKAIEILESLLKDGEKQVVQQAQYSLDIAMENLMQASTPNACGA